MAVFGLNRYERRVYTGDEDFSLYRKGHQSVLSAGEEFYIRPATSSDAFRVVLEHLGPTRVFTVRDRDAFALRQASEVWSEEEACDEVS